MKEKKIKLKEPVDFGGEVITEVVVQKPKGKHLRQLPANPATGDMLDLAARLIGYPPPVIDEMGLEDIAALMEAVTDFLPASLQTGGE